MSDQFGLGERDIAILQKILTEAGPALEKVAVFGSRAQGKQRENSDLDLVLYGEIGDKTVDRLWSLLQESSLAFSVDLKLYVALSYQPLKTHIDTVSRPLFIRTPEGLTYCG